MFLCSVPTPIIQALLIELLKIAAPDLIDNIHSPDLEDTSMSDSALFAVHLFHRWSAKEVCVREREIKSVNHIKIAY